MEIIKIALTGGPCAGKSSAEKFLKTELSKLGYYVVFIPESATRIINEYDLNPPKLRKTDPDLYFEFQNFILRTHLEEEEKAERYAKIFAKGRKIIIICDRGIPDGAAYMSPPDFKKVLGLSGHNWVSVRDRNYDAVFHLVSAADGAEKFYNLDNEARMERSLQEARRVDLVTKNAWLGHPHFRIIDNSTDFKKKLERLLVKVLGFIGTPRKYEIERKYLVHKRPKIREFPVTVQPIEIRQDYLKKDRNGIRPRLRRREQKGEGFICYETLKTPTQSPVSSIERERIISLHEYRELMKERDSERQTIRKSRYYFIWKNQVFEMDFFHKPARLNKLTLLEIELEKENDKVEIPEWLGPVTEVTFDPAYKNSRLAKKNPA